MWRSISYDGVLPSLERAVGDVELAGGDGAVARGEIMGGAAEGLDRLGLVGGEDGDATLGAQQAVVAGDELEVGLERREVGGLGLEEDVARKENRVAELPHALDAHGELALGHVAVGKVVLGHLGNAAAAAQARCRGSRGERR